VLEIGRKGNMKTKIVLVALGATVAASLLSGCVVALGNRVPEQDRKTQPTLGKELSDLKQAKESGAITEDEYQAAKKRLLDTKEPAPPK
jgi:hypothetical protein